MNFISRLIEFLLALIRFFFIDVWQLLWRILVWMVTTWRNLFKKPPSEFDHKKRGKYSDCIPMSHPAFKVPDPFIYSQEYYMWLGLGVTWDNPDIVLRTIPKGPNDIPVEVSSSALQPDTDYEIVARIWNNSTDAPIVDLPVSFSYLAFGIGTQSFAITDPQQPVYVTLGVKGGPNHPTFAVTKWRTPKELGHYCIQVKLHPVSDANYGNNLGQENTQVVAAQSPAESTFLLRNNTGQQATIRLEADTYVLPDLPACEQNRKPVFNPRTHSRALYPVPSDWLVDIRPNNLLMEPEQEQSITVMITPPEGFVGKKAFNINAFTEWSFLGGLTVDVDAK